MPNQLICNTLRFLFFSAVMFGTSSAQTDIGNPHITIASIKPVEWTGGLHPSMGSTSAAIKIVFFVDYQCPSCRTADPLVRRAVSKRPDVALIYREFPLAMHQFAKPAAIVAENARAHGTFDLAHRRLMEGKTFTESAVKDAARKAGVSTNETPQAAERIKSDQNLEKKAGLNYVPCFIVIENGRPTLMSNQQVMDFLK